jgi:TonB family protein
MHSSLRLDCNHFAVKPGIMFHLDNDDPAMAFQDGFLPPAIPGIDDDISSDETFSVLGDTAVYDEKSALDQSPEFLWMKSPDYPVKAKENKMAGRVMLKVLVDRNGKPMRVLISLETPQGYGFGPAAVKSAQEALFVPALRNGDRVNCWVILPVDFAPN